MKKHYDMIIANPPYSKGNMVTKTIIDTVDFDEFINLMPLSCYRHQELYKHVKSLGLVDPSSFAGAAITDNLNVAVLTKEELDKTYQELELLTFKEELRAYYELNMSKISSDKFKLTNKADIIKQLDPELDFIVPQKTSNDGVHKTTACIDYRWNFLKDRSALTNKNGTFSNIWVNLSYHNAHAKKNLTTFWYNNPIVDSLLFGINSQYGDLNKSIPNLNWNLDRPYETATLEDLMNWIKEDNHE